MSQSRFDYLESLPQGNHRASGVVLCRGGQCASALDLRLFLKGIGVLRVSAPGASSRNRFGGATEPLVWGEFEFYQSPRRLYVKGIDVKADFLSLRQSPARLCSAMAWCRRLARALLPGAASDDLLSLFWGSLSNLACGVNPKAADLRFAWRWASIWGVAPSLETCARCEKDLEGGPVVLAVDGVICEGCARGKEMEGALTDHLFVNLKNIVEAPRRVFLESRCSPEDMSELGGKARWIYTFIEALG